MSGDSARGRAPICVLVTGETVAPVRERFGDFIRFFERGIGEAWTHGFEPIDARAEDVSVRDFSEYSAVIVTGSPSSVTERAPWMLRAEAALRAMVEREQPLLGVCFGHQLLASALSGEVRKNPAGRRLGTHRVRVKRGDDPLFAGLPEAFAVNVSHEDHVAVRPTREDVVHLAEAEHDSFHAFRAGRSAWGVQFHPEFSGAITEGYVHARRELLRSSGLDPDGILAKIEETPHGPGLLRNFVKIVKSSGAESR
jgi:GMP synthase (glutamine-hydrolysing)